jgi:hypothetical protein
MANQQTSLPLPEDRATKRGRGRERERERTIRAPRIFVALFITWGLCLNAQLLEVLAIWELNSKH